MSKSDRPETLALSFMRDVDRVCTRFETAWSAGGSPPRVEDFLAGVDGPHRSVLALEILRIDAHYRRRAGDAPTPAEYAARFPSFDPAWIAEVFAPALPTAADPATASPGGGRVADPAPASVGGHEILGELGRGGMGVVYKARQLRLNRVVALKMVLGHERADSKELIRFLAEAEAVAAVAHPNVVGVYEYGDAGGRPYLAMEYCPGGSLADRLQTVGRLAPRDAAALIKKIADGVQAVHDRGIVHRDLKPANVLFDGDGEPKVTDFGLAKRGAGGELTKTGAILGTPAYMAPEQAAGRAKFVGPASDVWSVGVIFYQCLTGVRPFVADDVFDLFRKSADEDPPPPRAVDPAVPRDLDSICRKCLAKDSADRYRSAADLASDLSRYLAGEPVTVRSTGRAERAARWAARNPWVAGLAAALVLAVAAGAVVSAVFAVRETEKAAALATALEVSEGRRVRAEAAEEAAVSAGELAQRRTALAEAMFDFLLNEIIGAANPDDSQYVRPAPGSEMTMREALDRAAERVGSRLRGQPMIEATMQDAIGRAYLGLDLPKAAIPHLERAAAVYHTLNWGTRVPGNEHRRSLARAYREDGRYDAAITLHESILKDRTDRFGRDNPRTVLAVKDIALDYQKAGRSREAIPIFERIRDAQEKGVDAVRLRHTQTALANAYAEVGRFEAAFALHEQIVAGLTRRPPEDPFELVSARAHLAVAHWYSGRKAEGMAALDGVVAEFRKVLGLKNPRTQALTDNLINMNFDTGNYTRAADLRRQLLDVQRPGWPADSRQLASALSALGFELLKADRPTEAVPALRECLSIREKTEAGGWRTDNARSMLGEALARTGKGAEAEPLLRDGFRGLTKQSAALPARLRWMWLRDAADRLVRFYEAANRPAEAAAVRAEAAKFPREQAPKPRPAGRAK